MERIAIIGGSGAGKTTLGKQLAPRIKGTFVEVDAIQHQANWKKASSGTIRDEICRALEGQSRWVIDGTCDLHVGNFISKRADIINLAGFTADDQAPTVKLLRLMRRS